MSSEPRDLTTTSDEVLRAPTQDAGTGRHVAVVGAGAFGGWTAWHLLRAGCRVTLVDAWGPGNSRSSSGGDTRVLRHGYGDARHYQDLVARSLELFREHERLWGTRLFDRTGVLWLVRGDDAHARTSSRQLDAAGLSHEWLDPAELGRRYPQIRLAGIRAALLEHDAGSVYARRSCAALRDAFVASGGREVIASALPPGALDGRAGPLRFRDGGSMDADLYVFACGPWLGRMFPDLRDRSGRDLVRPSRQEVFTFGVPAGDRMHRPPALPVWADLGERFWYGIPGNEGRGFKIGDDTRGPEFDPTDGDRSPSREGIEAARSHLARLFPALADAPLLEARVCQYENSPDDDFVVDRHPAADNLWIVGGGSGHGFKHGPAVGELAASCVLGLCEVERRFSLRRLGV